ncbi:MULTISPECIES: DUF2528 family protein [Azotobacter]|uniref:DUF2528 family protein n=1 Tax=Azotobacter TaxID=352 RepID=UPI00005277CE|nr:DUF2528 family protein [Azotobacter vinelandii]GLK62331.1 hypothetical protein GCM10017624_44950 [Azotobacter vinelandii]SFX43916.1 Protein of unknown function [Azotobacter vinelandii]
MQDHQQSSGAAEASASGSIKRYVVEDKWGGDYSVTLEVDHGILTEERAQQINGFWSGDDYRLDEESGDVVMAVIRLAGATLIRVMFEQGGAFFGEKDTGTQLAWTDDLHEEEGWGGTDETIFGWCGIRCVGADVEVPGFDNVELKEVATSERGLP